MKLLLLKLSPAMDRKLNAFASRHGMSKSEAVASALDAYLESEGKAGATPSALDQVIDLIGAVRDPQDHGRELQR